MVTIVLEALLALKNVSYFYVFSLACKHVGISHNQSRCRHISIFCACVISHIIIQKSGLRFIDKNIGVHISIEKKYCKTVSSVYIICVIIVAR